MGCAKCSEVAVLQSRLGITLAGAMGLSREGSIGGGSGHNLRRNLDLISMSMHIENVYVGISKKYICICKYRGFKWRLIFELF